MTTVLAGPGVDLAQRRSIRAFRSGRYVLIVAEGEVPTPGFEVEIVESPLRIFPQQYNLLRRERRGIWAQVVLETGALFGGIAGFRDLFVRIRRSTG